MKILHVISSADIKYGGPIESIRQLSFAQIAHGHEVEVASLDDPYSEAIKTFPLRIHALGPSKTHYCYSPHLLPWLRDNASRYDAVIVNGLWQYGSFATWQALHGTTTPYFVFTHGMLDPWFKRAYPLKHLKKWLFWPWSDYRVLRDARAVFFTCEEERRLARLSFWLYRCNEVVVNFGTAAPAGDPMMQRDLFLQKYPQLRGKRLLLFLSRIHEKKGCDLLIKAFAGACHEDASLHLIMAGPDQTGWQSRLSALSEELGITARITWTGMLTGDLKWGAYRAAEAFILPSHQENFGIVVAEALACGLPVLISNKVNIWREIEADHAGLVADDTLAGTQFLLRQWLALAVPEKKHLAINARRCFEERFEIGRAADSLVATIEKQTFVDKSAMRPVI